MSLLMLLELNAAFEAVDPNVLLNRFEKWVTVNRTALSWFRFYLTVN